MRAGGAVARSVSLPSLPRNECTHTRRTPPHACGIWSLRNLVTETEPLLREARSVSSKADRQPQHRCLIPVEGLKAPRPFESNRFGDLTISLAQTLALGFAVIALFLTLRWAWASSLLG